MSSLRRPALYTKMQVPKPLLHIHPNRHADLDVSGQEAFWKFYSTLQKMMDNAELDKHLLSCADVLVHSRAELMNSPLTVFLSHYSRPLPDPSFLTIF